MSGELVYVSWGGTGRTASLRAACRKAADKEAGFVFLALLDDDVFGDLDDDFLKVVVNELEWLLDAQVGLVATQVADDPLPVRIVVRAGPVVAEVVELVESMGASEVLIGAPVPVESRSALEALASTLARQAGVEVSLVDPFS